MSKQSETSGVEITLQPEDNHRLANLCGALGQFRFGQLNFLPHERAGVLHQVREQLAQRTLVTRERHA